MSDNLKQPRERALWAANRICDLLRPVCIRIEIAGSLRREKPEVGDIEIVAIPICSVDLFGEQFYSAAAVKETLTRSELFTFDKDGDNYKKFYYEGREIWVDLFLTTPDQWGVIYMIRTGSAYFSKRMVTSKQQGGYMPSNYKVSGGRVSGIKGTIPTPEERDVFKAWGMKYIEPMDRIE